MNVVLASTAIPHALTAFAGDKNQHKKCQQIEL
jgi:hypothetical protein